MEVEIKRILQNFVQPLIKSLNLSEGCEQELKVVPEIINNYISENKEDPQFRESVLSWLLPLIKNLEQIKPIKLKSFYNHPVGYQKFILLDAGKYGKIRLHFWPQGRKGARGDIHDHRWPFVSIPITGSFAEERFERVAGDNLLYVNVTRLKNQSNAILTL